MAWERVGWEAPPAGWTRMERDAVAKGGSLGGHDPLHPSLMHVGEQKGREARARKQDEEGGAFPWHASSDSRHAASRLQTAPPSSRATSLTRGLCCAASVATSPTNKSEPGRSGGETTSACSCTLQARSNFTALVQAACCPKAYEQAAVAVHSPMHHSILLGTR